MNEESYLENLKHLYERRERERLKRKSERDLWEIKMGDLIESVWEKDLSCEFREREYVDLTVPLRLYFFKLVTHLI